ncbi:MAG: ABC transporter permease [Rhodobacteraceae bacterium]|nr:ABC transporter permease [Paracoccaceae bacterium]
MRSEGATAPAHSRPESMVLPAWIGRTALLAPTYLWLALAVFLPILAMLAFSFMAATPSARQPVVWTLEHYRAFIDKPYLVPVALTTLRIALVTTLLCAALGFLVALALVRSVAGRAREVLLVLILLPFWTNALVRTFSWTMVIRDNGLLDLALGPLLPEGATAGFLYTRAAIVLGLVHGYLPYMVLTCYIALSSIDRDLIEAAQSLGARWWTVLGRILLPLAMPGLVSGAVLVFVPTVGAFMEPRILGGRVGMTLGTVIEDQFTQAFDWPLGASLAFTMLLVVLGIMATFAGILRRGGGLGLAR